jgi:hypothetical protein
MSCDDYQPQKALEAAKTTKKDGRDRTWPLLINTSPRESRHNDPNEWGSK